MIAHRLYRHRAVIELGEAEVGGVGWIEGMKPGGVEVHGVDQHQARELVDRPLGQQVLDLLLGLVCDPVVDGHPCRLRCAQEIKEIDSGAIVGGEQVEVVAPERIGAFGPDRVHNVHAHRPAIRASLALAPRR